jgi:hypothetical protein
MAKLVDEPRFLSAFLPKILPLLDQAKEAVSDPEAREVCGKASTMLSNKAQGAQGLKFDLTYATELLTKVLGDVSSSHARKAELAPFFKLAAVQATSLNEIDVYDAKVWSSTLAKTLVAGAGLEAKKCDEICAVLRADAEKSKEVIEVEEVDDGAEVLCDLPFGLAYGNKVLMRKTKLSCSVATSTVCSARTIPARPLSCVRSLTTRLMASPPPRSAVPSSSRPISRLSWPISLSSSTSTTTLCSPTAVLPRKRWRRS